MESLKYIHHLVSFPEGFIKGYEEYRRYNDENGWKNFKESEHYHDWIKGGRHRGSFLDKEDLINIVEKEGDPYGICECYYHYLLIETHHLDCIDGCCWFEKDHEHETWFEFTKFEDEDGTSYKYVKIDRPECLKGTVGFL